MLFFATHTIFIMQKRKELFIFPNPVTKLLFLTFFLLGLHNNVFIHISWYLLFQSLGIKNGVVFLWIIFNTVFYFCQDIGWLEHKPLRRYSGKVMENTSPVESRAKSSEGQYEFNESYCLLISTDTHGAQARNFLFSCTCSYCMSSTYIFQLFRSCFSLNKQQEGKVGSLWPLSRRLRTSRTFKMDHLWQIWFCCDYNW